MRARKRQRPRRKKQKLEAKSNDAKQRRKISLWLLDLGGDCSGNGISELVLTVRSAVAQFERTRIGERISDAKARMRLRGLHQVGTKPFG